MLARTFTTLASLVRSIVRDRRGVAAVFLAVSLVPVIGAVGLAVDSSVAYLVKTRMGKSLDAAGLAAGRVALDDDAEDVARQFFDANFGEGSSREHLFEVIKNQQQVPITQDEIERLDERLFRDLL